MVCFWPRVLCFLAVFSSCVWVGEAVKCLVCEDGGQLLAGSGIDDERGGEGSSCQTYIVRVIHII